MEQKENQSNKRRKIVLGLAGGIAGATQVKEAWFKPVINAVVLPAHAQTTVDPDPDPDPGTGQPPVEPPVEPPVQLSFGGCFTTVSQDFTQVGVEGFIESTDPDADLSGYTINISIDSIADPTSTANPPALTQVQTTATTMADGSFSVPAINANIFTNGGLVMFTIGFVYQIDGTGTATTDPVECSEEAGFGFFGD